MLADAEILSRRSRVAGKRSERAQSEEHGPGSGAPPAVRVGAEPGFARREPDGERRESAPERIRTSGLSLRRAALYPLSYGRSERG